MPTLSIDWERSPRIIIVDAPDTEISAQQIVDLCRDAEDETDNAEFLKLVNAAGKEDLGGGTSVGITIELQNAKIGFDDRTNKLENGTVTTSDATGVILTDSAATFQTNLVVIGDLVVNTTDGSHATIVEVTSETDVRTTGLQGGTDNQFASADTYEVWEIVKCEVTGGNVVAVDEVDAAIEPLLPTFGVYAVISKASTGTLQEQGDIQHASFDGGVHVDVTSSQTGSAYPSGNSANPVNNWADAKVVDTREGFDHYFVDKSTSLDNTVDFTDAAFTGKSIIDTVLAVPVGTTVDKAEFTNLSLEGSLGETTIMQRCFLGETNPLLDVRGVVEDCSIGPSPLTLGGSAATTVRFVRCNGAGEDTSPATVNGGGDGPKFDVQDYTGALKVANKTGEAFWDIHVTGELIIDSTCIAGVIRATGAGNLTDSSGSNCTVIDEMLKPAQVSEMWRWQGLEFGNPMTVTTAERSVADQSIVAALTGDGTTTTTVTRTTDQTILLNLPLVSDLLDVSITAASPTFTRATAGTYIDSVTGFITEAAIDTPRFELSGLLLEPARTNLLLWSEDFSNWKQTNGSSTFNQAVAPDGATTADKLLDDSSGGTGVVQFRQRLREPNVFQAWKGAVEPAETAPSGNEVQLWKGGVEPPYIASSPSSAVHVFSVYAKADQLDWIRLNVTELDVNAYFNLIAGEVGATKGTGNTSEFIEDLGSGRYRCGIVFTAAIDGNSTYEFQCRCANANNDDIVDLDGTSSAFFWGAVLEAATDGAQTSYIKTTTAAVSRSADFLAYNTNSMITDNTGSMIATITPNGASVRNAVIANIADQLVGPLYLLDNTTQEAATGDGTTVNSVALTLANAAESKIASRWSTDDNELEVIADGVAAGVLAYDGAFTRTTSLRVGSDSTGNHLNGNIKAMKIYSIDRGTAQLQVDTG